MSYGDFRIPFEDEIPTESLIADYARLAEQAEANPRVKYYVRYRHQGGARYGLLQGGTILELNSHYFDVPVPTGVRVALREVRLIAPLDPNHVSKVVGVALNTVNPQLPEVPRRSHPRWFSKGSTSLTGPGGGIEIPPEVEDLVHEAELVVVIGREGRHLGVAEAAEHIWGVTAGNDMTEFSWLPESKGREAPPRLMAKGIDTFSPIGPAIAVGLDYSDLAIVHRLNGRVTQTGSSADRLQSPSELVAHLSRYVTLLPGDVIFTGATPFVAGVQRTVAPGDELEVEIAGIGVLRNRAVGMRGRRWEEQT
jgi:2-keto-4-pentenoate hydratase/2-oxohepta-3-ene-1,7-dioic acid hydratase in catechol pathway